MALKHEDRWAGYDAWNRALADLVYGPSAAGAPVYLDLEPELLVQAAAMVGVSGDPREALLDAVRATLYPTSHSAGAFGGHISRLRRWSASSGEALPVVALLAVLSLAAEDMREADGFAANNYYGRLMPLLGITDPHDKDRIIKRYRDQSFNLWESLNGWLEEQRGERGLPTAYSYAHAHVGRPLSQALIRSTDREKLSDMFVDLGMEAHARLSPQDMEVLLGQWIARDPSPASHQMRALWRRSGARERITEIACELLQAWEPPAGAALRSGAGSSVAARRGRALLLLARLKTFPSSSLELNVVGPDLGEDSGVSLLDPITGENAGTDLAIEPLPDGRWRLAQGELIEPRSMLEGMLRVQHPAGIALEHRPRRVVPLKRDTLVQGFVEAERLGLGEDGMVLAQEPLRSLMEDALSQIARPGFRQPSPQGLPDGWCLFTDVQVVAALASTRPTNASAWPLDLNVLQPLASSQVVTEGGLQLPGRLRRWSTLAPPEVRVTTDGAERISVCVERVGTFLDEKQSHERSYSSSVAVVELADLSLDDGDYEVAAIAEDVSTSKKRSLGTTRLRLRSGDHPNATPPDQQPLGRALDELDRAVLGAGPLPCDIDAVRGPEVIGSSPRLELEPTEHAPGTPSWWENRRTKPAASSAQEPFRVVLGSADPSDCFRTGSHIVQLPTYYGKTTKSTVEGVCKVCGLVKRYPSRFRESEPKSEGKSKKVAAPSFDPAGLPPVLASTTVDAATALDALTHDRAGRAAWLEQLALQVEPSQLFVDRFVRALDALGHVEVSVRESDLRPVSWEVMQPRLVQLRTGGFALIGGRSRRLLELLKVEAVRSSVALRRVPQGMAAPELVVLEAANLDQASDVARSLTAALGIQVTVVAEAAAAMCACLPPLSRVLAARARQAMPSHRLAKRWDPATCRWTPAGDAFSPGAYQLHGQSISYWLRDETDSGEGTGKRLDARLVKYAAGLGSGQSLIGYDKDGSVLFVPLGADLPGLYGRVAVLSSGLLPAEDTSQRLLRYHNVAPAVAARLATLLVT